MAEGRKCKPKLEKMSVGMRKNKSDEGKTGQKLRDKIEKQIRSPRDTQKILFLHGGQKF